MLQTMKFKLISPLLKNLTQKVSKLQFLHQKQQSSFYKFGKLSEWAKNEETYFSKNKM